jgi:hypothetical protein
MCAAPAGIAGRMRSCGEFHRMSAALPFGSQYYQCPTVPPHHAKLTVGGRSQRCRVPSQVPATISQRTTPPPQGADRKKSDASLDARGNAAWEWSMSTGIFGRDVDSDRLKKLKHRISVAEDPLQKSKRSGLHLMNAGPGFDRQQAHVPSDGCQPPSKGGDPYNTVSGQREARSVGPRPRRLSGSASARAAKKDE